MAPGSPACGSAPGFRSLANIAESHFDTANRTHFGADLAKPTASRATTAPSRRRSRADHQSAPSGRSAVYSKTAGQRALGSEHLARRPIVAQTACAADNLAASAKAGNSGRRRAADIAGSGIAGRAYPHLAQIRHDGRASRRGLWDRPRRRRAHPPQPLIRRSVSAAKLRCIGQPRLAERLGGDEAPSARSIRP
jgi:hypothetical protein